MSWFKLYTIALARYWWLTGLIENEDYEWWLEVIQATPDEIYHSPFFMP